MKCLKSLLYLSARLVAPLVGAWIEISLSLNFHLISAVAPLVGAWIEITSMLMSLMCLPVAPLVGAWIEIILFIVVLLTPLSLLSWERGLKFHTIRRSRMR